MMKVSLTPHTDATKELIEKLSIPPPNATPDELRMHELSLALYRPLALRAAEGQDMHLPVEPVVREMSAALSNAVLSLAQSQDYQTLAEIESYCKMFCYGLQYALIESLSGKARSLVKADVKYTHMPFGNA